MFTATTSASLNTTLRPWQLAIVIAVKRSLKANTMQLASSLAFSTVFAIVPLLAVILSIFAALPEFEAFSLALQEYLANNLLPSQVSSNIMEYLNAFAAQASHLSTIGGIFLVGTIIALVISIDDALNAVWCVQEKRNAVRRLFVYILIIVVGPILLSALLWTTAFLARESFGHVMHLPALLELSLNISPFIVSALGFMVLFVVVPNTSVLWRDALLGGLVAALLLYVMKFGFALYVTSFSTYTLIYGAFAAIPVFLLWVYFSWLSVLLGAHVAASLPLLRKQTLQLAGSTAEEKHATGQ
jgi:membrane protein